MDYGGFVVKKEKKYSILFFIASILFYIAAIISFTNGNNSMVVVWLCLGSAYLCLGSTHKKKEDNNANTKDK